MTRNDADNFVWESSERFRTIVHHLREMGLSASLAAKRAVTLDSASVLAALVTAPPTAAAPATPTGQTAGPSGTAPRSDRRRHPRRRDP